jgi:hypothetical protein
MWHSPICRIIISHYTIKQSKLWKIIFDFPLKIADGGWNDTILTNLYSVRLGVGLKEGGYTPSMKWVIGGVLPLI